MGWILEVAKMCLYVSFPVGIFYYVNQPAYYDEYVIKAKKEFYPLESKKASEEMENFIRDFNANIERERLEAMEKEYATR
ncbi:protein PET100 homolog, mitochondrial-like [Anoplolepis gracilipes]|uniref:protein PET100 homolog, mitochondrial-like n=1 Tax=Anoplolepis gracilipes TaxID=354296 RepID=UPI003BA3A5F0